MMLFSMDCTRTTSTGNIQNNKSFAWIYLHSTHDAHTSIPLPCSLSLSLHLFRSFIKIASLHLDALHKWKHCWIFFFFSIHLSLKRNFAIITSTIAVSSPSPPLTTTITTTIHNLLDSLTGTQVYSITSHHTNIVW